MAGWLSRDQLVALVKKIMNSEGTEEQIDEWERQLRENVPHPGVSDLIFHPQVPMSAEEIVEVALNYRPIQLAQGSEKRGDS